MVWLGRFLQMCILWLMLTPAMAQEQTEAERDVGFLTRTIENNLNAAGRTETVDDDGNPITVETGGASFVGAQLEARIGVTDTIGVVGFYDAGFVDRDPIPSRDGSFQAGAGIGIRYNTPIGPIRFDLATPASGDNAGKELEFYIGIGQSF